MKLLRLSFAVWILLVCRPAPLWPQETSLSQEPHGTSGTASLSASSQKAIDALVESSIADHKLPSAVVVIGHKGEIVFENAYATSRRTVFDMASMTKVLVTAPAVMQLYEQGRLGLDDPVAKYLPDFAASGKGTITIRQLMTHSSGLAPDLDLTDTWSGKQEAIRRAFASVPTSPPGTEFRYSDINYIVLGALVEKLSGLALDEYATKYIFQPLGLKETRFLPPAGWESRIAPTQLNQHGENPPGSVHDPTARRMGGVAGHAGLFSTASDVAVYAQSLLDRLKGRPSKFPLKRETLELMIAPERIAGRNRTTVRGLGWDIDSVYSSPRGKIFGPGSFGHTGFTGTSLWIDPESETFVILLSNAVYPRGHTDLTALRSGIATLAASDLASSDGVESQRVETGIDVLEADHFVELATLAKNHNGKLRLGLLTNQTGIDARGQRTADILAHDAAAAVPGLALKLLFSPEHGINGAEDREGIANSIDSASGLPVISLYGRTDAERRPSTETLRQLDAVVIDLQDVGVRFYTYETLVHYFLEAAAQTRTDIVVLDRPDPINGLLVQGPLSDQGRESYVNAMPVPVRHGMTLGELARYYNGEGKLGAPLTIISMHGWRRQAWFDKTGLAWINPSPNLRSLAAATLYPALGLIETTNLSVGRGTETPFAFAGAPWIEGSGSQKDGDVELARFLNARAIPGVSFEPVRFTPEPPYPFAKQTCYGVRILVTDRNNADMPEVGLEIASALRHLYGSKFELARMDRLLVNRSVLDALESGRDPRDTAADWAKPLSLFNAARKQYLLY
ncbi:MAG TPA: serine hydrolase [Acidobacteriaceae bacterium]